MYRYLALVPDAVADSANLGQRLLALGLSRHVQLPGLDVYASAETPVQVCPGNRVLIGHLFSRTGNQPIAVDQLPPSGLRAFTRHLINECWGEYVLLSGHELPGGLSAKNRPNMEGWPV